MARVASIRLRNFGCFEDLVVEGLSESARGVVLIGPNGSGKSCLLDALGQVNALQSGAGPAGEDEFAMFPEDASRSPFIEVITHQGMTLTRHDPRAQGFCSIRSGYRHASILGDRASGMGLPATTRDLDRSFTHSFDLLCRAKDLFDSSCLEGIPVEELRGGFVDLVNRALKAVLGETEVVDVVSNMGGEGSLYLSTKSNPRLPYSALSSGEREVVDLVLYLVLEAGQFDGRVFCLDEPDLHMHSMAQRRLLSALIDLVLHPDSQVWVSTHGLGTLREAIARKDVEVLDLTQVACGVLRPVRVNRSALRQAFTTALDDLTDLVVTQTVVFCEGEDSEKDEKLYSLIFDDPAVEFVSTGNRTGAKRAAVRFYRCIARGLTPKVGFAILDRDGDNDEEVEEVKSDSSVRILQRYSLENYLLDPSVVRELVGPDFDCGQYVVALSREVARRIDSVKQKIRAHREGQYRSWRGRPEYETRVADHPLLGGVLPTAPDNFGEWFGYIPAKEFLGFALLWVRGRYAKCLGRELSCKQAFAEALAKALHREQSVRGELERAVFPHPAPILAPPTW